ncbi:unnamed protein product [Fraxinus pennsylvanica]|uniref:GPI inositol-deacylase PGAP1-like alpha/beta domain-containing protein n=1 Tax=Fraxinus pennsylvanica TaxID=56036 RepID=A0AAD2A6Y3_9LAMI|nr:unnamed protein product [Fraxinus pennsylvanica]
MLFSDCLLKDGNFCLRQQVIAHVHSISTPANVSSTKYSLFLYHEGWRKIGFNVHLKKLNGILVLFIPGNGRSYKQVTSVAAESERAYQRGILENNFCIMQPTTVI